MTATWDFVAFRVARERAEAVINTSEADLETFTRLVATGDLGGLLSRTVEPAPRPRLERHQQTMHAGVFASVSRGGALLPRERVGVGAGPVSSFRPGKVEDPPPPPPPEEKQRSRFPWWPFALGCIGFIGGFFLLRGGGDQVEPDRTARPTASATAGSTATPGRHRSRRWLVPSARC